MGFGEEGWDAVQVFYAFGHAGGPVFWRGGAGSVEAGGLGENIGEHHHRQHGVGAQRGVKRGLVEGIVVFTRRFAAQTRELHRVPQFTLVFFDVFAAVNVLPIRRPGGGQRKMIVGGGLSQGEARILRGIGITAVRFAEERGNAEAGDGQLLQGRTNVVRDHPEVLGDDGHVPGRIQEDTKDFLALPLVGGGVFGRVVGEGAEAGQSAAGQRRGLLGIERQEIGVVIGCPGKGVNTEQPHDVVQAAEVKDVPREAGTGAPPIELRRRISSQR